MDVYGLIAIFIIMLLKEIGLPIPIPSDLLMLAAAAQAAGRYVLWQGFGIILLAMLVGAWCTSVRRFGRPCSIAWAATSSPPDVSSGRRRRCARAAQSASPPRRQRPRPHRHRPRLRPGRDPLPSFLLGVLVGSGIFLALHFAIGYIGGPIISAIMNAGGVTALIILVALAAIGLVVWLWLRRRGKTKEQAQAATVEGVGDWLDACCPVCLAIGAVRGVRESATGPAS
ncbi:MAG: hypothetical protein U0641_11805 [Anaerolineae bacterium]